MSNFRVSLIVLALSISAAGAKWSGFQSDHVTLFTDREDGARSVLTELESARAALAALGLPVAGQSKPITLLLASKQSDLRDAWPSNISENGTLGGLAYAYEDRVFVLVDMSRPEAHRNLLHEYIHALVGQRFVGVPRWIDEGIAEHYSTLAVRDGQASLGRLDARRRWRQDSCPRPGSLRQILEAEPNSFISQNGSGAFYLPSAITIRYLIEKYGISRLYEAINSFREGTSIEMAIRKTYEQSLDEIEAEAIDACRSNLDPKEHASIAPLAIVTEILNDSDRYFSYMYADILARSTGHQDQAISRLRELLRTNKDDALAKRGIGVALLYKGDFDNATMQLQESWKSLKGDATTLYHLVIACTNSSNCQPEDYLDDAKALLVTHPELGKIKDWSAEIDRKSAEDEAGDSPFLPEEKPAPKPGSKRIEKNSDSSG